jgi:hypothetical protein
MVDLAQTESLLCLIYSYDSEIRDRFVKESLHAHPLFSAQTVLTLLRSHQINKVDIIELLNTRHKAVTPAVLAQVITDFYDSEEVLRAAILHPLADMRLSNQIITQKAFSPAIAKIIIEKRNFLHAHLGLLPDLTKQVIAHCSNELTPPSERMVWENVAMDIFKSIKERYQSSALIPMVAQSSVLNLRLSLLALGLFHKDIATYLPISEMAISANQSQIHVLMNFENNGRLSPDTIDVLSHKCTSDALLTLFLQRPDLTEEAILNVFNEYQLNENHLLLMLKNRVSDTIFERIRCHPQANQRLRKVFFHHDLFS